MKTVSQLILTGLLLCVARAPAQNPSPAQTGQRLHATLRDNDDLTALDYFLSMSDTELDQLQTAIARVRAMSALERAAFREKIIAYRQLPENDRQQLRQGWGWQNEQDRNDWRSMMQSKTEPERSAIQTELQSVSPEQRTAHKHKLLEAWRSQSARR